MLHHLRMVKAQGNHRQLRVGEVSAEPAVKTFASGIRFRSGRI